MVLLWIINSVAAYVVNFYTKYMTGNLFIFNTLLGSTVVIGVWVAGSITKALGLKKTYYFALTLAGICCILLALLYENTVVGYICLVFCKFGLISSFNTTYLGNTVLFPAQFTGTVFALTNCISRTFTLLAP